MLLLTIAIAAAALLLFLLPLLWVSYVRNRTEDGSGPNVTKKTKKTTSVQTTPAKTTKSRS
jgi:hypothetical protein